MSFGKHLFNNNHCVAPSFTRDDNKLTATIHLLETVAEPQISTLDITFTDGRTQHIESEVSSQLDNSNLAKHIKRQWYSLMKNSPSFNSLKNKNNKTQFIDILNKKI